MKKFFTLIALFEISTCAVMAQKQILNGGFEDWGNYDVNSTSAAEPRYWHSFSSASGPLASLSGDHCFISTDHHSGKYSAAIKACKVLFGVVANGTMTTGRLNAGAPKADNPANHAELDINKKDGNGNPYKDNSGDPFYQILESRPDYISFWAKFSTGLAGTNANMSAYITDGTYYQAPEDKDKTYNNKIGWAEFPSIVPCSEWTHFVVPFEYANTDKKPKAILLTFSTSVTPGGGDGSEVLLVDDVELIYKGDVNGDTNVNINDVVSLVNIILGNQNDYDIYKADVNGDKSVNINDVVTLVNRILGN